MRVRVCLAQEERTGCDRNSKRTAGSAVGGADISPGTVSQPPHRPASASAPPPRPVPRADTRATFVSGKSHHSTATSSHTWSRPKLFPEVLPATLSGHPSSPARSGGISGVLENTQAVPATGPLCSLPPLPRRPFLPMFAGPAPSLCPGLL